MPLPRGPGGQIDRASFSRDAAAVNLGQRQDVLHNFIQDMRLPVDVAQYLPALGFIQPVIKRLQVVTTERDDRDGGAQLVRHIGDELILEPRRFFEGRDVPLDPNAARREGAARSS